MPCCCPGEGTAVMPPHRLCHAVAGLDWDPEGMRLAVALRGNHPAAGQVALFSTRHVPVLGLSFVGWVTPPRHFSDPATSVRFQSGLKGQVRAHLQLFLPSSWDAPMSRCLEEHCSACRGDVQCREWRGAGGRRRKTCACPRFAGCSVGTSRVWEDITVPFVLVMQLRDLLFD